MDMTASQDMLLVLAIFSPMPQLETAAPAFTLPLHLQFLFPGDDHFAPLPPSKDDSRAAIPVMGGKMKFLIRVGVLFRTYPVMDAAKDFKYLIFSHMQIEPIKIPGERAEEQKSSKQPDDAAIQVESDNAKVCHI
ncbi:hypothetical protein K503DRAFT_788144 [Rhizopogon vinicolor AM-OR11-026]|uniref:Uncharacterized protein n=1 Tax=Rhizopogon vinicolor AM-OR11-026 TaxID=1314800 RepID=A0A1B7MEB2_9AGAM|nr:hypothetical protein K503DRAFT_788144 [Rhizopogon vinicolor AM-OR11-026]